MATNHQTQGAEHISSIAKDHDFRQWRTLWDANGDLSGRRANPNILFTGDRRNPGDVVIIPEPADKRDSGETEQTHRFEVRQTKLFLRLRILRDDFQPMKDTKYKLILPDGVEPREGKTDANGQIEEEIARQVTRAVLMVRMKAEDSDATAEGGDGGNAAEGADGGDEDSGEIRGDVPVKWELKIGGLNPLQEQAPDARCVSGVQQRLNNLAINCGPVDGIVGPNTRAGLTAFQELFGLEANGRCDDDPTQSKLVEVHDKPDSIVEPSPSTESGATT